MLIISYVWDPVRMAPVPLVLSKNFFKVLKIMTLRRNLSFVSQVRQVQMIGNIHAIQLKNFFLIRVILENYSIKISIRIYIPKNKKERDIMLIV